MGRPRQAVKLSDVAQLANVSIATVSIILNGPNSDKFPEETRKRVYEAARSLNYIQQRGEKNRDKSAAIIGLVIPDLTNLFYPEVTSGFSRIANEMGYQVILLDTGNSYEKEKLLIRQLLSMQVTGLAICGISGTEEEKEQEMIRDLMNAGVPVVQFDRYTKGSHCPYVGIDNYYAGYYMTEKLLQSGHRNIALLTSEKPSYIVRERQRGYEEAMRMQGLSAGVFSYDRKIYGSVYQKFYQIVHSQTKYTAVFTVGGDVDAIECIRAAGKMGLRIPMDISIAGFDDISLAEITNPALTTIHQPKTEIGETAMRMLAALIRNQPEGSRNIILPFEYKLRESTQILI